MMRRLMLTVAALLVTTPAWGGSFGCRGIVSAGPEWITVEDHSFDYKPGEKPLLCLIKTTGPFGKRFLKVCPVGVECTVEYGDSGTRYGNRTDRDGNIIMVKWPSVEKTWDPKDDVNKGKKQ
jgi:hypothetical protein